MTTSPFAYIWGDDDLAASRAVDRLAAALAAETGQPLERWELRGQRNGAEALLAQLHERVGTAVMFGGGTMTVVTNVGALMQAAGGRDAVLAAVTLLAPGNALVFLDITKSGLKGPPQRTLAAAIKAAEGAVLERQSPKAGGLAGWVEKEARERGLSLGPGAAKAIAERVGGFVSEGDAERRFQTRTASMELDKLALYRETGPITVEDVRALVAEVVPGSVFAFADAVGERRTGAALALLERLVESTPEPVLIVVLHRRMRDILEVGDRLATGQRPAEVVAEMKLHPFVAGKLADQARVWTTDELRDAIAGLVELDAQVKGAPGSNRDAAQRRLGFTLWVMDHVGLRARRTA